MPAANEELRKAADELGFALIRKAAPFGAAPHRPDAFVYSVHLADKFYTPEAMEKIDATGKP